LKTAYEVKTEQLLQLYRLQIT